MGSTTYHDEFARCPECGNATVGLSKPFAINHAKGCSMPVDQIERGIRDSQQDRRVTELLRNAGTEPMSVLSPYVWSPRPGRAYAGCPTCGNVRTVVSDGPDDLPWCIHHDGEIVWRSGSVESGWTPMVPVSVGAYVERSAT